MDIVHKSHDLYISADFTEEEISRNNVIAVKVIKYKEKICKKCGGQYFELLTKCRVVK